MPLSELQRDILRLPAAHRNPESYVAGSVPLNRDGPRFSDDIDIFHDREESVALAAAQYAAVLENAITVIASAMVCMVIVSSLATGVGVAPAPLHCPRGGIRRKPSRTMGQPCRTLRQLLACGGSEPRTLGQTLIRQQCALGIA